MKKSARGFTLIELLIVIAVLGILAVAVLSAINPIEQINRSYDTGSRSDAEQLLSAIDRYYATTEGIYPWQTTTNSDFKLGFVKVDSSWLDDASSPVLGKLSEDSTSGTGELKKAFVTRVNSAKNPLYIHHGEDATDSNYVCFKALSNSFKAAAKERCGESDGNNNLPDDLKDIRSSICGVGGTDYYSCLP